MYAIKKNIFSDEYLNEIIANVVSSPYLAYSPLGVEFFKTQGFSIVFSRSSLEQVKGHFPYLIKFLDKVLFPKCNAFYINPLILKSDSRVDPHIDCRLVVSENTRIIPNLVTVLYVNVSPKIEGGELVLNVGRDDEIILKPSTNTLVHFRGNIIHSVQEVKGLHTRISLVCEQYNLTDILLNAFPEFDIIPGEQNQDWLSHSNNRNDYAHRVSQ